MSNPIGAATPRQISFDGVSLLRWCGYAASAGLLVGLAVGTVILFR